MAGTMELQEKIAVQYLFEATHVEHEAYIMWDYFIRKQVVLHFAWTPLENAKDLIRFHQN